MIYVTVVEFELFADNRGIAEEGEALLLHVTGIETSAYPRFNICTAAAKNDGRYATQMEHDSRTYHLPTVLNKIIMCAFL